MRASEHVLVGRPEVQPKGDTLPPPKKIIILLHQAAHSPLPAPPCPSLSLQHEDDLNYLFDSLSGTSDSSMKAIALCKLADMCQSRDVRQYLRAHGRIDPLIASVLAFQQPNQVCAPACAFCACSSSSSSSTNGHDGKVEGR